MAVDLQEVLDGLHEHVKAEMANNPDVVDKGDELDVSALPIVARKWHRLEEGVAVVADLKGSTHLSVGKHPASTAAIYEAATGGVVQILHEFGADFIAIQGDGAFGLFWGERRMERAVCAGITIKTFSVKNLVPQLESKWPELPRTGFKVGIAASRLLVKRVGIPGLTEHQEPVWAGKAVNYAAKCAQQAETHQMIVAGSVWDFIEGNDYLAATCTCGTGPTTSLWQDVEIEKIHVDDGERYGRLLGTCWCDVHGPEYCEAVMAGETTRPEADEIVTKMQKALRSDQLLAVQAKKRRDRRNQRAGLASRNR